MDAGRALDWQVAEKVMGWHRHPTEKYNDRWHDGAKELDSDHAIEGGGGDYYQPDEAWLPSTDIRAAWEVVEKLRDRGLWLTLQSDWHGRQFNASFHRKSEYIAQSGMMPSAPLAICLAALAAVGAEISA